MKKTALLVLLSFVCGHLLLIFTWHDHRLLRHLYSFGALVAGYVYFRNVQSKKLRAAFVGLTAAFFLILLVIYVFVGEIPILKLKPPGVES